MDSTEDDEANNPALLAVAKQTVENAIAAGGQQVPDTVIDEAAELLACLWRCGLRRGVKPKDWTPATMLATLAVDAAVTVAKRQS